MSSFFFIVVHCYIATFQKRLHTEYKAPNWYDIQNVFREIKTYRDIIFSFDVLKAFYEDCLLTRILIHISISIHLMIYTLNKLYNMIFFFTSSNLEKQPNFVTFVNKSQYTLPVGEV